MDRTTIIATLRAHEAELKRSGAASLSLFGSVARGEAQPESDIDLAFVPDREAGGRFSVIDLLKLESELSRLLEAPVDLVVEPSETPALQEKIDRDRVRAY